MVLNYNRKQRTVRLGISAFGFISVLAITIFFGYEAVTHFSPSGDQVFFILTAALAFAFAIFDTWLGSIFYEQVLDYLDE